jgi:hypothetical protein
MLIATILVTAFLLLSESLQAGVVKADKFEWDEITAEDWAISRDTTKKIFDAAMIFEKINADDEGLDDDRCYRTIYRRIRVLTDNGREWGDVEVPILSFDQKIEAIQGRTVLEDGTSIPLDDDHVYEKESVKSKQFEFKQFTFSMPSVTNDCIIEYIIKYRLDDPVKDWTIQKDIPLLKGQMHWKYFQGTPDVQYFIFSDYLVPNYLWLNCNHDKVKSEQLPNLKDPEALLLTIRDVPPYENERYSLPESSLKAKLVTYYSAGKASISYWGDIISKIRRGAVYFCEENDEIDEVIESFGELKSDHEKIDSAFNWIQENIVNLAYDDIYNEKGKKEKTKNNESIDDILERGYGSRREVNLLFYDMLREMNVDAKLVYAVNRNNDILVKDAKYWQFDSELIAVPEKLGGYKFYAPGYKFTKTDFVPWFLEGIEVLVEGSTNVFEHTPFADQSFSKQCRNYNLTVSGDLDVSGELEIIASGHCARSLRVYLNDNDTLEYETLLKDRYEDDFGAVTLDSFTLENYENRDEPVRVTCKTSYPDLMTQGDRLFLNMSDFMEQASNPFYSLTRRESVLFNYAYEIRESVKFGIPPGWIVEALPEDSLYANKVGRCGIQFTEFGDSLTAQRYFVIKSPFWPVDFYPDIKKLFQARQDFSDMMVVMKREDD